MPSASLVRHYASSLVTGGSLNAVAYLMEMHPSRHHDFDVHQIWALAIYLYPSNGIKP